MRELTEFYEVLSKIVSKNNLASAKRQVRNAYDKGRQSVLHPPVILKDESLLSIVEEAIYLVTGKTRAELRHRCNSPTVSDIRTIAYFFLSPHYGSYADIGKVYSRNRSTVQLAIQKYHSLFAYDIAFREVALAVSERINELTIERHD